MRTLFEKEIASKKTITKRLPSGCQRLIQASLVVLILLFSACTKATPPAKPVGPPPPPPPAFVEHKVQYSGETLGIIARWYTGKSQNWKAILDANPGLKPERLSIGDVVKIPREIVNQEQPLPKKFVSPGTNLGNAPVKKGLSAGPVVNQLSGLEGGGKGEAQGVVDPGKKVAVPVADAEARKAAVDKLEKELAEALGEEPAPAVKAPQVPAKAEVKEAVEKVGQKEVEKAKVIEGNADAEREKLLDELLAE